MFSFYEGDSLFHTMNPVAKLVAIGLSMIMLTVSFDPVVPGVLLVVVLVLACSYGKVPFLAMIKGLIPFLLLGFGFFWMQIAFARDASGPILLTLGPISVYQEAMIRGMALALRVLCYAAYALLFVATTDPSEFILSLMQQGKLPPVYGYSILAAYRFFPLYQSEYQILKEAHQVRGANEGQSFWGTIKKLKRYAIPLLAQAIRKAERVAIAMEAKGFTGKRERTYYRKLKVHLSDVIIASALILLVPGVMLFAHQYGWLIVWRGSVFF